MKCLTFIYNRCSITKIKKLVNTHSLLLLNLVLLLSVKFKCLLKISRNIFISLGRIIFIMCEDAGNYRIRNNNLFSDTDKFYNAIPMSKKDIPYKTLQPNSKTKLYTSLTGLTVGQMMNMVLSNGFVPANVKYNTIIWDNWDIFSQCKYLWKVVRKQPSAVKLWGSNQEIWACIPAKKKNLFEPRHYNATNTQIDILTEEPVPLELALIACENNIDQRREKYANTKKSFRVDHSSYSSDSEHALDDCEIDTQENIASSLRNMGIDEENAELLSRKRYYIRNIALGTITNDVEPSDELIKMIIGTYKNISLLTTKEVQEVLQYQVERSATKQRITRKKPKPKYEIDSFLGDWITQ